MTHASACRWTQVAVLCVLSSLFACRLTAEPPAAVLDAERGRVEAIGRAVKAAVAVFANGGRGGGSGVVISPDGYALSNYHVVKPAGTFMKCGMADGRLYDAVVVGIDPTGDVAMIKLLGRQDFPTAELGDSDRLRVGDWCFAVGNPFLLATDFQPTVSYGIVSGIHRYQPPAGTLLEYADCVQTDAAINPGNSGGPLFDSQGRLVGINGRGSFEKRGRVNVGVGYAISINQIKKFLGYLQSGRYVDHATLGATVATDDQGRVVVSNILDTSDAFRRGLRYGDQLLSFGGRSITTVNGFKNVLGIYPKGWRVPMSFLHEGERVDALVRLAGVHSTDELLRKVQRQPATPPGQPRTPKKDPRQPGKRPGQEPPTPDQPDKKPTPMPVPHAPGGPAAKPPAEVAKLIKKRDGYVNFYFNELNTQRVWGSFAGKSDYPSLKGVWEITGKIAGGGPFTITLGPETLTAQFPASRDKVDTRLDFDQQLFPLGSGGLLPALHVWQRLVTLGPEQFGEVYYLGAAPLLDHQGLVDVLVGTCNVVESRFSFDRRSGELAAVELFPDSRSDPCEVYLSDYQQRDGCLLPHRIQVRYGDSEFADLEVEQYRWK